MLGEIKKTRLYQEINFGWESKSCIFWSQNVSHAKPKAHDLFYSMYL